MHHYYKFLNSPKKLNFRKNYFLERLRYIVKAIKTPECKIWDCGCGYGTTGLFLAMNEIPVHGTTLEFYSKDMDKRYAYWSQYGNPHLFTCSHENLFEDPPAEGTYDKIIVQDTLHHLEPIDDALNILKLTLREHGQIIGIEENGSNILQRTKLFFRRGNKRIIKVYDEKLNKEFLMGNENIRSINQWSRLFINHGFDIQKKSIQYLRYYLPWRYNATNCEELLKKEQEIQKKSLVRKEYLFFGINFIAEKR